MSITSTSKDGCAEINLSGRFTFSDSPEYRKVLAAIVKANAKSLVCNLSDLGFMDSSGLGMLMVTLKECQQNNIALELRSPRGDVKHLLDMTKANERFKITG